MLIKLKGISIKKQDYTGVKIVEYIEKGEIWCFLLFMKKDFSTQMVTWSWTKK